MISAASRTPVALFGIVLGLSGLGSAWRVAHMVWGLPAAIGETIVAIATTIWLILLALYGMKWSFARREALAEFQDQLRQCFVALVPLSSMLIAIGLRPYLGPTAFGLFLVSAAAGYCFALYHIGVIAQGGRDPAAVTPALILPALACCFISAIGAGAFDYPAYGRLAFGAGVPLWITIEIAVRARLYLLPDLPAPLRPTLGMMLAPPTVGAVAWLSITTGPPDIVAELLIGCGLLQCGVLIRLLPWIARQPFAASYWAFSFGIAALALAPLRFVQRGGTGPVATLAPILFAGANLAIGVLATGSLVLLARVRRDSAAPG